MTAQLLSSPMTSPAIEPGDKASQRIPGYDLARALAILGMMIVHFALVMSMQNLQRGWLSHVVDFFDGRAAATFVVLAGAGLSLRSRKPLESGNSSGISQVRRSLLRRGIFLFFLGLVNLIIWPGDILRVYGVSICLAAWLLKLSDRRLWIIGFAFVTAFLLLICTVDYEKNWDWQTLTYHRLWTVAGLFRNLFYDGFRPVIPWTGLFFIGIWVGRRDLRNPAVRRRLLFCGVGAWILAETASFGLVSWFRAHPSGLAPETITALFGTHSIPPLPLFLLSATGVAIAVIALSHMVAENYPGHVLVRGLVPTGQMAFTWYFGHIVLGLGGVALLGLTSKQPLWLAVSIALIFFCFAVLASLTWKRYFRHGPLEWLMRRLAG